MRRKRLFSKGTKGNDSPVTASTEYFHGFHQCVIVVGFYPKHPLIKAGFGVVCLQSHIG